MTFFFVLIGNIKTIFYIIKEFSPLLLLPYIFSLIPWNYILDISRKNIINFFLLSIKGHFHLPPISNVQIKHPIYNLPKLYHDNDLSTIANIKKPVLTQSYLIQYRLFLKN